MGFYKYFFPIFNDEKSAYRIAFVSGWKDENGFGYNKAKSNRWICTDLMSGTKVYEGKTREECSKWTKANMVRILKRRKEDEYTKIVTDFKYYLKMEAQRLIAE